MIHLSDIGFDRPKSALILVTGDDFEWHFQWKGGNFPVGASLYLLVGNADTKWDFTIVGDLATLNIESAIADLIPNGAPFSLLYKQSRKSVLTYGQVRRSGPRKAGG